MGRGQLFFQSSTYFTEGSTDLPLEASEPKASPVGCVPECTIISKETCSHL